MAEPWNEKRALRRELRLRRDALATSVRDRASKKLADCNLSFTQISSGIVSGFYPFGSELDTQPLLTNLSKLGFRTALPVIVDTHSPLIFRSWKPGDALIKGVWDIPVPSDNMEQLVPNIILVPLLGFDDDGYRIGYGGGYYDRTLAHLHNTRKIVSIGLAYAAQHVPYVPRDDHDVPLDWILTEQGPKQIGRQATPASKGKIN